tara:strand:- start:66 stop:272 length:207 start_codon:yes stop_codon:yes gene_type:complete
MCKYIILLLLSFEGEVIKERLEFTRPMDVYDCMDFGNDHREQIATYDGDKNTWFLNDGRGTFQGFICE